MHPSSFGYRVTWSLLWLVVAIGFTAWCVYAYGSFWLRSLDRPWFAALTVLSLVVGGYFIWEACCRAWYVRVVDDTLRIYYPPLRRTEVDLTGATMEYHEWSHNSRGYNGSSSFRVTLPAATLTILTKTESFKIIALRYPERLAEFARLLRRRVGEEDQESSNDADTEFQSPRWRRSVVLGRLEFDPRSAARRWMLWLVVPVAATFLLMFAMLTTLTDWGQPEYASRVVGRDYIVKYFSDSGYDTTQSRAAQTVVDERPCRYKETWLWGTRSDVTAVTVTASLPYPREKERQLAEKFNSAPITSPAFDPDGPWTAYDGSQVRLADGRVMLSRTIECVVDEDREFAATFNAQALRRGVSRID